MMENTATVRAILRFVVLTLAAALLVFVFTRVLRVNQTTVALGFLALILVTAYRWGLSYSVYLSLLCTFLYNFFFLPPLGRLVIEDAQNWVALATFLLTSVLVSHLSNREHREAETSETRRRDVELLYRLSQKLLVQDDARELARGAPSIVAGVFGFKAVALYVRATDAVYYSDPEQILATSTELRLPDHDLDTLAENRSGVRFIQLRLGMQDVLGRLAVTGEKLTPEMYEAIGSLVAVALERAAALERSSRLEAARESERLRTALVDSVTHDLRTPLTAIRAAATSLQSQRDMQEAERNELVAVVEEESARLDRLIGQAIEMAKLDSHALRLELNPQDVRELVDLTLQRMRAQLETHPVVVRVADDLPQVRMDRTMIQRVLQHLLENAASYSPANGAIEIAAEVSAGRVQISVADHGPGVAAEERPFVFEKYYRGKQNRSRVKGTGMGLAIARAIVRAHQGEISVESEPGHGARFVFWIPLTLAAAELNQMH
jgi:two-component system sensor histidine kinase KdpD